MNRNKIVYQDNMYVDLDKTFAGLYQEGLTVPIDSSIAQYCGCGTFDRKEYIDESADFVKLKCVSGFGEWVELSMGDDGVVKIPLSHNKMADDYIIIPCFIK